MKPADRMIAARGAVEYMVIAEEKFALKSLAPEDGDLLGDFLTGLSSETARRFQPHPLTRAAAKRVCGTAADRSAVRFITENLDQNTIVGYMVVEFVFPQAEVARYRQHGVDLIKDRDCRIAPAVADAYQDRGIGSSMMRWVLDLLASCGCRQVVLFGGTQADNHRAIHFYRKTGFGQIGPGAEAGLADIDMMIALTSAAEFSESGGK